MTKETKIIKIPYYEYKNAMFDFIDISEYINIIIEYIEDIFNDEYIYLITVKFKDCEFSFKIKEESIFKSVLKLEKIRDIIETDKQLNDEIHEKIILSLEDYFNVKYGALEKYFKNKYENPTTKKKYINLQGSIKLLTVSKPNKKKKKKKIKNKNNLNINFNKPNFKKYILLNELYYHLKLIIAIKKSKKEGD
jgi:hypothetical protein